MTPTTATTMQALIEQYRGMEATQFNAAVAERVLRLAPREVRARGTNETVTVWGPHPGLSDGTWSVFSLKQYGAPPDCRADFAADHSVLEKVKTWDVERLMSFCLVARTIRDARPRIPKLFIFNNGDQMLYYECGDHALCALVAYDLTTPLPPERHP